MTTRWPCLVVTAFCALLAIATSAAAECAWVLWGGGYRWFGTLELRYGDGDSLPNQKGL